MRQEKYTAGSLEWLEFRKKHLTGTDIAPWLGRSIWKNKEQVKLDKLKSFSDTLPHEHQVKPNNYMAWGALCEEVNMQAASKFFGVSTVPSNDLFTCDGQPVLSCTIDGYYSSSCNTPELHWCKWGKEKEDEQRQLILEQVGEFLNRHQTGLIEMKQTSVFNKSKWLKAPPTDYVYQVQQQLLCADKNAALLVARIGTSDIIGWPIERDELIVEEILEAGSEFSEWYATVQSEEL